MSNRRISDGVPRARASLLVASLVVLPALGCGEAKGALREDADSHRDARPGHDPLDGSRPSVDAGESGADSAPPDIGPSDGSAPVVDAGNTEHDGAPFDTGPFDAGPSPLADRVLQVVPDTTLLHETTLNRQFHEPVWNGSRWVLFWERIHQSCTNPPGPGNIPCVVTGRILVATVLGVAGDLESVHVVATLDAYPYPDRDLDAIATADGYLVAWVEPTGPALDADTTIHVAALDAGFVVTHEESFGARGGWWPKLAGGGSQYGLFWQEHTPHQQDYFAPITAGGVRGAPVPIAMADPRLGHHLLTDLAWDGSQFGLLYESDAERIARCGCAWSAPGDPVEELLTLLTPSGSRITTVRLSEGIEEGMEIFTAPSLAPRPGGGFAATWVSTVGGGPDVVMAQVDASGTRLGPNRRLTSDDGRTREITPRIASVPGGYFVSYGFAEGTDEDYAYGVRVLQLDASGAEVSARTLVPSPPACAALESATFAGTRCCNGSRMDHRLYQAAADRHVVTTWPAEVWTTLPGDPSGDWIIDHVGFAGFTHW